MITKYLGQKDYQRVYQDMIDFTENRNADTEDEIWCVEHPPVFTQGRHGDAKHIINTHNIEVVQSDRGGQITYHGSGQAVIYFLFDLKRAKLGIKSFVCHIEKACIDLLKHYGIKAHTIKNAPGIYVDNAKIASLGLRVKKFNTYHGLAINTNMDLTPFNYINPCGFKGLAMTQISRFNPDITVNGVFRTYMRYFLTRLQNLNV